MAKLIMMVGISGSGKSTKARKLSEEYNAKIFSSDEYRLKLLGDEKDQSQNQKVFSQLYKDLVICLVKGENAIYDATNISLSNRRQCLERLTKVDCEKIAYVLTTTKAQCLRNNLKRERQVPEYVIGMQQDKFQIPFKEEGFNEIILDVWENYDFAATDNKKNTEAIEDLMRDFDQQTPYHFHDLLTHCTLTKNYLLDTFNIPLIDAARVHDIGKVFTQTFDVTGVAHYHSHENRGTYLLLQNLDSLWGQNIEEILTTLFYINYHMMPFNWQLEKTKAKYKAIFGEVKYNNLLLFHEADKKASQENIDFS